MQQLKEKDNQIKALSDRVDELEGKIITKMSYVSDNDLTQQKFCTIKEYDLDKLLIGNA